MRDNVKLLVQLLTENFDTPSPVLDIGSMQVKGQEAYADVRPLFPGSQYLGCDMQRGTGVDALADCHHLPFRSGVIGTALLLDTLEHVLDPIATLNEVRRILSPEGVVVISSHMSFPIHAFPSDYWRFTPMAFHYLLRSLRPRRVFAQGDGEFPHTVIGLAMRESQVNAAAQRFLAAAQAIQTHWPEDAYGGPLLPSEPSTVVVAQVVGDRRLPELTHGRTIAQNFTCTGDNLARIDVKMSNLGRANYSHVLFRLHEAGRQRREVAAYRLFAFHVIEDAWTTIPIPVQTSSGTRDYVLSMESPDGTPGQGVTAVAGDVNAFPGGLYVDGELTKGSLCFKVYCLLPDATANVATRSPSSSQADLSDLGELALDTAADRTTDLILRTEERRWAHARHLASLIQSRLDAVDARLETLERVQGEVLEHSATAASLAQAVRRNLLARIWKRLST